MTKLSLVVLVALVLSPGVTAAVPSQISVQGRLLNAGSPMTGAHPADFKIYDAASAGNLLWTESSSLIVQAGIFTATLGSTTPIPAGIFGNQSRWLDVTVDGTTLSPRLQLTTSAYAFWSQRADTASFALNASSAGDNLWSTDGTNVWRPSGNVGIGFPSPVFSLDVAGGDARFERVIGGTDFIVSPTPNDVRLFSQANVPVFLGTNGDAFKVGIQANGRVNIQNSLGVGPSTPWADHGIYMDAGTYNSLLSWDNRVDCGFYMYQAQGTNIFYLASSGGGSGETWRFVSAGLGDLFRVGATITSYRDMTVNGNFTATGTKCREVNDPTFGKLYFNAVEAATADFTDRGEAQLVNGACHVDFNPKWLAGVTIDDAHPMQVTITAYYGPHGGREYVERTTSGFTLIDPSGSNARFGWKVEAGQKGYEGLYLH